MAFFGKNVPKNAKKGLIRIAGLIVGICAVLSLPLIASLGWFASSSGMRSSGLQVVVSTDLYDLLIDRSVERYDEDLLNDEGDPVYPGIGDLKTQMAAVGYDFVETSTEDAPMLAFELISESTDSEGNYSLIPGSYGTMTFYLRPTAAADGSAFLFSFLVAGYQNSYDLEDNLVIAPVTDETTQNMLKGHLLFFRSRTGARASDYQYDGLIETDQFLYDTGLHEKCDEVGKTDCYKITLYWEWPVTYEEILYNTGTDSPEVVVKRYPPELSTYVAAHPEYFFASYADSVILDQLVDGYNDGDQAIGDNVNYVVVSIR